MPALGRRGPSGRRQPLGAAREHLANERTLLAWVRTAVTLIALGFAAARFGVFVEEQQSTTPGRLGAVTLIGVALVCVGTVSVALSLVRFLRAREQIGAGRFRAELWPEAVLAVLSAALGIAVVTYLLLRG